MKVSILIPTLGRLAYLRESLASARAQTHTDLEIVVSDDGSTDGSREYVTEVAAIDRRVRLLVDDPTPGVYSNIGYLVEHASGEAFCILGDDDRLDPRFVERLVGPLRDDREVVATFAPPRVIDARGRVRAIATRRLHRRYGFDRMVTGPVAEPLRLALAGTMWLGACLFRADPIQRERFDPACGTAADWDLAIRIAERGRIFAVSEVLWDYRDHATTASRSGLLDARIAAVHVLEKHRFADPDIDALRIRALRRKLQGLAIISAVEDRRQLAAIADRYRAAGGSTLHPTWLTARGLTWLPRRPARMALSVLTSLNERGSAVIAETQTRLGPGRRSRRS